MVAKPTYKELEQRVKALEKDFDKCNQAEMLLKESEAKYRSLVETTSDWVWEIDKNGKYTYSNSNVEALLGYQLEEVIGKTPFDFMSVDEADQIGELFRVFLSSGKSFEGLENINLHKDGRQVVLETSGVPISDASGNLAGYRGIDRNITDRKRGEEALRDSEENYRSLFEHAGFAITIVNAETGERVAFNKVAYESLGYTSEEYRDLQTATQNVGETTEEVKEHFRRIIEKGSDVFESQHRTKDGEIRDMLMSAVPILTGGEIFIQSIRIDITDRKQAEEALRDSEYKFRSITEQSSDLIAVTDLNGMITYASPSSKELFAVHPGEMVGCQFIKFLDELAVPIAMKAFMQTINEGRRVQNIELLMKRKDGTRFYGELTGSLYESNSMQGTLVVIRDINDRKRLEAQLQQAQKMESIGTLAGGIAHDFNNILSPIMVYSEMAMMDLPADSPVQHNLKGIYSAGERARDLVNQILTFSRKGEDKKAAIKITPIFKEILKMLRSSIPTTIEIKQSLEAESDIVLSDPTLIQQVILNLCTNASHAMKKNGGILEVTLAQEELDSEAMAKHPDLIPGSYLKLTVSDTGSGIDDETMQKIFEPYFTTKQVGEGTGMGLALVHGIVKGSGGDISVESELGKGTTIEVYLPRVEKETSSVEKSSDQLPKGSERVLFVDDEKVSADVMTEMLEVIGYKVTPKTSSIDALKAFENDPNGFDLVITDMTMPIMTGKTLAKEVMSIRSDIPIILCTGYSEQIDESSAKEMGISAYLMKPIAMRDMANIVRDVLDKI